MAEIKFSCSHCGQHISCDEQWSGHEIGCPACLNALMVPHLEGQPAPAAAALNPAAPQTSSLSRAKLKAGVTQVARSTAPSFPQKRNVPRPPKTTNPAIKYAAVAMLLGVIGIAALKFLPGVLNQAQEVSSPKATGGSSAPMSGGGGPLGEMNGAMDVSDALDGSGGGSRSRGGTVRTLATSPTNSAAKNSPQGSSRK
jgi:hypothetical protein